MRAAEFQHAQLDHKLTELCELLMSAQAQCPDDTGDVAACISDPEGKTATGVSLRMGKHWIHAEVLACERYREKFGDIPVGSVCVTTLSPCNRPMADRVGPDCASYLQDQGIDRVYAGHSDETQDADNVGITQNVRLRKLCKKFAQHIHQDTTDTDDQTPTAISGKYT
jgi:pyrimidine deaminase RibD-like protein